MSVAKFTGANVDGVADLFDDITPKAVADKYQRVFVVSLVSTVSRLPLFWSFRFGLDSPS